MILGGKWDGNADGSDILDGIGGASIGSEALKALAEGFQNRKGNAIVTIGEGNFKKIANIVGWKNNALKFEKRFFF